MTPPHRPTGAAALTAIVADSHDAYASATAVIADDLEALVRLWVAHLRSPSEQADPQHQPARTHRLRGSLPHQRDPPLSPANSILSTIWAALELTSHGWRGVVMTLAPWPIQNAY